MNNQTPTLEISGANIPDILDKCKVMLAQCWETAGATIDNKADRLTVLHQLEITEILLYALERPLQSITE